MDERQRRRRQLRRRDPLALASAVFLGDVGLAARLAGAVAGVAASGLVGVIALALLVAPGQSTPLGWWTLVAIVMVVLLLALTTFLRRRRSGEATAAVLRTRAALGVIALALLLAVVGGSIWTLPIALFAGLVAAMLCLIVGLWTGEFAARCVVRVANERRQGWYARIRASRLTRRMLGYAAYRQLRRDGALPVKSGLHPNRTYLVPIRTTPSGARILVLDGERPIGGLCLRPRQPLPDPEEALTHILAIRTDERAWLDRANFFPQDRALTPQALGLAPGRPGNYER